MTISPLFSSDIIFVDSVSERKYNIYLYEYELLHLKWCFKYVHVNHKLCHFIFKYRQYFSVPLYCILPFHSLVDDYQANRKYSIFFHWNKQGYRCLFIRLTWFPLGSTRVDQQKRWFTLKIIWYICGLGTIGWMCLDIPSDEIAQLHGFLP